MWSVLIVSAESVRVYTHGKESVFDKLISLFIKLFAS